VSEIRNQLSDAFRWAIEDDANAQMASADWLARDILPGCEDATDLLTGERTTLAQLQQAKNAFKTLRIVGETSADRRVGARLYVGAIAAALVRYDRRISTQSTRALRRGLAALRDDKGMEIELRDLAAAALSRLNGTPAPPPTPTPMPKPPGRTTTGEADDEPLQLAPD
jgi:hypothetical protein